jgi:uncharacterized FlgJ-related protein
MIKRFVNYFIIVFIIGFCIGTFFPNTYVQNKNDHKFLIWAKSLGFGPPRFEYTNNKQYIDAMKKCISYINFDLPPSQQINTELIIAQSIVESDYGRSRFAKEGNNLFGIRIWSKNGILPYGQSYSVEWRIKTYKNKCESVQDYVYLLNTKRVYAEFRRVRQQSWIQDPLKLASTLNNFSTNKQYEQKIVEVIHVLRNSKQYEKL